MSAITKIEANDIVFSNPEYINDRLVFNYIEGARQYSASEFFSDSKNVIICKKKDNNSVWIWTDDDIYDDKDAIFAIANTIKNFNTPNLEFYVKPAIAQIFSDMYALISGDLDYQIKSEFSLGAYKFCATKLKSDDSVTVQKYSKKNYDELFKFYSDLKDEFHWSDEKLCTMVNKYKKLNTFLLLKNGEVISVCVICDDDGNYSSVRSVATKTNERNKGYGTFVVNIASASSEKGGSEKIMLYANNANISAISAFKKAGFKLVGNVHLIKS